MIQETVVQTYTDVLRTPGPLDFKDVRRNTQLVKKALVEVMVEGVDYGKIPGCGDKPGLFKAGSEKLGLMFKLGCFPNVKNESDNPDIIKYVVLTKVIHLPTGIEMCVGVGCASTDEEKYKWRKVYQKAEYENSPEERRRIKYGRDYTVEQVRTNPADVENTILKMAAKRSMVDAIIKATAATDIFNQGEDDIIIDIEESRNTPKKPKTKEVPIVEIKTDPASENVTYDKPTNDTRIAPEGFVKMSAKFDGTCKGCNGIIYQKTMMFFNKTKGAYHNLDCIDA